MKPQSYLSNKDPEEEADKGESEADLTQLNTEELGKLKAFLRTFQDGASCSLVQQGNTLSYTTFTSSKSDKNSVWVLDSGAMDFI